MQVSRAIVEQQSSNIAKLGASALVAVEGLLRETGDVEAIPAMMRTVTEAYSTMSAAITAEYYGSIRRASKVKKKYTPEPFSAYDAGKVTAAAISIIDEVVSGRATAAIASLLGDVVNRYVKNSADECIRQNVRRDPAKPRYAIVPNGDACAFCVMRASNGYTYATEDAVESHNHCTCTATPVFGDSTVQGYDVSGYQQQYKEAAVAYKNRDYSDEMAERIKAARERHNERYAAGETDKKWSSTNAVLMIMREQQGIK